MAKLFGFEFKRLQNEDDLQSFAPPVNQDGALQVALAPNFSGTYIDLEGSVKNEAELVTRYREMALVAEIDWAIDDIVNEMVILDAIDPVVQIVLEDLIGLVPDPILETIVQEFKYVTDDLLNFRNEAYNIVKKWYIDGRLYYHTIILEGNPKAGIQEMRPIDPRKIKKIVEVSRKKIGALAGQQGANMQKVVKEYYAYNDSGWSAKQSSFTGSQTQVGIKIARDAITYVHCGIMDKANKMVLGHLQKAIKPLNVLRAVEDATLIYRISRAPERRIFYIDTGNLPRNKADQYVTSLMQKYKNKIVYDNVTGEVRDDRKFMTMMEDFWLPRREGGRGTEITQLPAGQNLGQLEDVNYFQSKLYRSLNVPFTRMDPEGMFSFGRVTEITRDEVKFAKFIDRCRAQFSKLFSDVLGKQVVLKGIMSIEDWEKIAGKIRYQYGRDNYFHELKEQEIENQRAALAMAMMPLAGHYISHREVRRKVMRQTDDDMKKMDSEIAAELNNPQYIFPELMPEAGPELGPPSPGGPGAPKDTDVGK